MSAVATHTISVAEYLAWERAGTTKHEYYAGTIIALAGSSEAHNLITTNLITTLNTHVANRPCKVYPSDMRLRIPHTKTYTYPDITVVCGPSEFDDAEFDTLLNPLVLIEILSPATERNDRGRKFHQYQTIPTVREYILVEQDEHRVDQYIKQDDGSWIFRAHIAPTSTCLIESLDCAIPLHVMYHKVDLDPPQAVDHANEHQ